jgi:hypothetical protein
MDKQIKIPGRSGTSRVERALKKVPRDNDWHRVLEMAFTVAEQTARAYNVTGGEWEWGYTHETRDGELGSVLWARSVSR